ncbi:hypothetical protein A3742_17360 [Oleiphilus sp. HI0071]|nr:histidine phosphatase family protein [Oleiphilus sp. HI0080]KZY72546.1 hypothetical protein A3737_10565 [Oleiphilus sp. HI0065]KZY82875.1 hypothetical protein A3742_08330 [Oleiphilus sp. HI0071]KZZ04814.1 hypothetical protein A3744_09040 [Oleiphilus sp. HI0073]KZZ13001.1 hypothetical protein A3750_04445 [Oleiphilus sp. HI0079]KZZ49181.1 hypothetical protein A3760_03035 [Oleiphilus sp. HI0122]KZZ77890.1 hypothetical protein A3767_19215 [Oleiphilus sp. HI0133]
MGVRGLTHLLYLSLGLSWGSETYANGNVSDPWVMMAKPGHVVLMRHTLAPGTGDPENFDLSDCASQRNLSQAGRNQAQQTGEKLRAKGYSDARVITSQWCRCKETAQLLALGEPEQLASLNSFFQNWEMKQEATNKTKAWIAKELKTKADGEVILLVTHQVNITALTGHFPRSGEMVVSQQKPNGDLRHVASIDPR